jgi:phage recombination protein Bet
MMPASQTRGEVSFTPLGESAPITLTIQLVKKFLVTPTKSGALPTDEQVTKFIMLCKARSLNPWENDAYLVGYDSKDGPSFSLITAHQAFLKRAEASPEFDGMESGVVVRGASGSVIERQGDLVLDGEILLGGWARVHRRDRKISSYDSLALKTFNTGRSRWAVDAPGMIVKCAEASALRKAFPSSLAAMYCREEMEHREAVPRSENKLAVAISAAPSPRMVEREPETVISSVATTQADPKPSRTEHAPTPLATWSDYLAAEHGEVFTADQRAEFADWAPDRVSRAVEFSMRQGFCELSEPDA